MARKLTAKETEALNAVELFPGETTSGINDVLHNRQSYESYLRDRLFNLAHRGLVRYEEKTTQDGRHCVARRWFPVSVTA